MVHTVRKQSKSGFPYGQGYNTHIVVYVPSTDYDKTVSSSKLQRRLNQTAKFLSDEFGGSTIVSGTGSWYDTQNKKLIKERVVKVESFSPMSVFAHERKKVQDFLAKKVKQWKQHEVAFEFESPKVSSNTFYRMNAEGVLVGS